MKVMFDTNVYISFIRDQSHAEELQLRGTVKYISAITLMELWAGARIKKAERLVHQLQKPYAEAGIPGGQSTVTVSRVMPPQEVGFGSLRGQIGTL